MTRGAKRLILAGSASGFVLAFVLATFVLSDGKGNGIATGQIYSTDAGDPIDVFYGLDQSGQGCMNVRGSPPSRPLRPSQGWILYGGGSNVSCFDPDAVANGGTYQLALPADPERPALVVGVMPAGATGATVGGVGRRTALAETRGRWFLASLEPSAPDVFDLATIRVEFDP